MTNIATPHEAPVNFDPTQLECNGHNTSGPPILPEEVKFAFSGLPQPARIELARAAVWHTNALTRSQFDGLVACVLDLFWRARAEGPDTLLEETEAMRGILRVAAVNPPDTRPRHGVTTVEYV